MKSRTVPGNQCFILHPQPDPNVRNVVERKGVEDGSGIDEFESNCNTDWGVSSGRTLLLVDPTVVRSRIVSNADGKSSPAIGGEYSNDLTPAVIRSLMTSEISDVH